MVRRFRNQKLSDKLILFFILISVIPIVAVQGYNYVNTRKQSIEQIDKVIKDNLVQIAERTNLTLEIYTNLLYQIYIDDNVTEEITILTNGTQTRRAAARSALRERLRQYTGVVDGIRCVSLVCTNGEIVTYDYLTDSSVNNLWARFPDLRMTPPYMEARNTPGMVITPTMEFLENGSSRYYFHISKRLFDFDHLEKGSIGTVILSVDERILNEIGNPSGDEKKNVVYYIRSSETEKLVSYPMQNYIARNITFPQEDMVRESGYLGESRISLNSYTDEATGWTFCNAYDVDFMLSDLKQSQRITVITSSMILLSLGIIMFFTIREFSRSVRKVVDGMKKVEQGNLDTRIEVTSEDEIGQITESFNQMTLRLRELIDQVGIAKDRQREAEIQALEAQINPHFLYNTLDSINWMAIEHHETEISRALRSLGLILRYTVSHSNEKTTVKEEIRFLELYLELQDIRFEGAFSWQVESPPEVLEIRMHKLLIQPFVENAVLHGMAGIEQGGEIRVEFGLSDRKDFLQISISDNGNGIPEELRDLLNDRERLLGEDGRLTDSLSTEKDRKDPDLRTGLGLRNAFGRIVMYYGSRAHWNVNSVEKIGTEIMLYLPLEDDNEDSDR